MSIPEGFKSEATSGKVCKLLKSLYGLKQSLRQWYVKMHNFLVVKLEFKSSSSDPILYIRHNGSSILQIALYVDDLLIAESEKTEAQKIKNRQAKRFKMKDLGIARVMLSIEITRDRPQKKLFISQSDYSKSILERLDMLNAKAVGGMFVELLQGSS